MFEYVVFNHNLIYISFYFLGGPNVMPMNIETSEMIPPPPHYPGFSAAAMAAAVAANQQLALITSQGIPFMSHAMPALYTSPSG